MFCTLTYQATKKRFHKNLKIENKTIGEVEYLKAVCYKQIKPSKIENKIKSKVDTIILSSNLSHLEFKNIKIYNDDTFFKNIAISTFKKIISYSNIPANKLTVCLVDKNCNYADFSIYIAKRASVLKIITENEKYNDISEKIYDECGMKPIITSSYENCDLGFNLDCENPRVWFKSQDNFAEITKHCVNIGIGLKSLVPKGINPCDFASALQEYNSFKRLRLLEADLMKKNEKYYKINFNNIKNFLDNASSV